jgi:CheY-like chemotaxis protein
MVNAQTPMSSDFPTASGLKGIFMELPKILIVDDDVVIRMLLRHTLSSEPCQLIEAGDGRQALELVERELPDLVLLDVMMPELDGMAVLRQLKADERTRDIPVIIITALTAESDVAASLDQGAIDHITKPFSELIVRTRVRAALRGRTRKSAADGQLPPKKSGRRIGFVGVKGGVGVTTAAVNTAIAMTAPQRSTALVDLRPGWGTVAMHLGVPADRHLGMLLDQPSRSLTSQSLEMCLTQHRSGARLLLAPPAMNRPREIAAQQAGELVRVLGGMFDFVIVDLPCLASPASRAALHGCDYIVLTLELEATCLALAKPVFDAVVSLELPPDSVGSVLILHQPSAGTVIGVSSARSQLPCPIVGVIPPCGDQNLAALKNGVPVVHSAPSCAAAVAYMELGARLMAERIMALTF